MPSKSRSRKSAPQAASEDTAMDDAPPSHQPTVEDDTEEQENPENMEEVEDEDEDDIQRVKIVRVLEPLCMVLCNSRLTFYQLPGSTPTAASFEFLEEGHTMGNALRHIIMKK
jgi:DNA-directed RNA polymerase I and III subunit RPAC2